MVKTVKTMQGKTLDMEKLQMANEMTPAVGNVKVNARGDELGPGGKIVKTREETMKEFYDKRNKNAVKPDNVMVPDSDGE
jgi:hypothetical protein